MNAHLTLPAVTVKQHVLTMMDHLLVRVTLGIQEMASNVPVSILEIFICFCSTSFCIKKYMQTIEFSN